MNTIAHDQDTTPFQRLLKARQRVYSDATRYQILQFALTVVVPVCGAAMAFFFPQARPWVAIYGLIVTALDVIWMDRAQRRTLKVAARISEEFDCGVLKMPWNAFVAGKREDAETVDAAARRWEGRASSIKDWYTGITPNAIHAKARLVCQRMNLQYDSSLRRTYGTYLIWTAAIAVVGLIVGAAVKDMKMLDFAAFATTVSPAIFWAVREQFRQSDAAAANETLKDEAERFLEKVGTDGCEDLQCEKRSREFQDAIFQRRVANPLILPFVYYFKRDEHEKQARAGADALLR